MSEQIIVCLLWGRHRGNCDKKKCSECQIEIGLPQDNEHDDPEAKVICFSCMAKKIKDGQGNKMAEYMIRMAEIEERWKQLRYGKKGVPS